jgi:hypothetical protein
LGTNGELTDTLSFELAAVDKTKFIYQWYKHDPKTLLSTAIAGATSDTLFFNDSKRVSYGITDEGKVYQFYCVVVGGSQYGISDTARVVYGTGARLANGGWIKVANANLGAKQDLSLDDQIDYKPSAETSTVGDKAYDPTVYGDWYEWGREKDGHQERRVLASGTVNIYLDAAGGVETSKLNDEDGQIKSSETTLYGKFIQRNVGMNDWRQYPEKDGNFASAPANAWTWGNPVKGITDLDPCKSDPELGSNWRVPTQAEWAQIASNNTWIWHDGGANGTSGYQLRPGGTNKPTSLFLPAAGCRTRNGGVQIYVGYLGYYWSSAVTGPNSYSLYYTSGSINVAYTNHRTSGLAVRCVSEYD